MFQYSDAQNIALNETDSLILCVIICRLFTQTSTQPSCQCQQKIALSGKKGELQYLIHQVSHFDAYLAVKSR